MNTNNQTDNSKELDLYDFSKSIISFFRSIEILIYRSMRFFIRNIKMLSILIVLGVVLGFFWDKKENNGICYKHEIILKTNFGSSSYLYKKIESNNVFYKENPQDQDIIKIDLYPIIDIVSFLKSSSDGRNVSIAKYLSENNISIDKYKYGEAFNQTSIIYDYHLMTIYTYREDINNDIINNFLAELNDNPYFVEKQKIIIEEKNQKTKEYLTTIQQINAYLDKVSRQNDDFGKNVSIDFGNNLSDLIEQKNRMQVDLEALNVWLLESKKTFFEVSTLPNILVKPLITKKIILPTLLVFCYFVLVASIKRYKKYKLIVEKQEVLS